MGQDPERGHVLRDGGVAAAPVGERVRCDVLVIGGGATGMAAAWRLARAGERSVHVLELEPELGGTARGGQTPRSPYPMGAHYLPAPHPELASLRTLLLDLGVATGRDAKGELELDPTMVCRAPLERHRHRGKWEEGLYPGAGQSAEDEQQWGRWRDHLRSLDARRGTDGRRLFSLPVDHSSTELRHLDRISMATYLDRLGLDGWRLRWAVEYALRDDYGCTLEQCSAFAGLHHYLSRGLEDTHDRFILTWPEGNARLVSLMAEAAALGDRLHRDTVAHAIDPDSGEVRAYHYPTGRQRLFEAQRIVWAAPRFVLSRVLPPSRDPLAPGALGYVPWVVANVELARRPRGVGAPLSWDNVPVDTDDLGYVVATHLEPLPERSTEGTVVTFYQPLPASDDAGLRERRAELLAGSLEHWCDHVTSRLEAMHPGIGSDVRRIHVARWGHAMIQPRPGHLFGEGRAVARRPIGRVLPCAADVGGLPLFEEAFTGGVRGAEWALAALGRPPKEHLL